MKIVVENIFMCLVLFWKCYFPTNFSHFLNYFLSIQTNFIQENFKNHSQIPTPHTTETPIQPTTANSGNQKPQPPKHLYHTTTTTTKIKITQKSKSRRERDRWVKDQWVKSEIARVRVSERRRDRAARCNQRNAAINETGVIWCVRSLDRSSGFANDVEGMIWAPSSSAHSLSLSLFFSLSLGPKTIWSENRNGNEFQWSKLLFYDQIKMISGKFYFQNQPNSLFYEKWFPETI